MTIFSCTTPVFLHGTHYWKIWSFTLDFLANGVLSPVDCCSFCEWSVKEWVSQLASRQEAEQPTISYPKIGDVNIKRAL